MIGIFTREGNRRGKLIAAKLIHDIDGRALADPTASPIR
jgi:hypothetical protein